MLGQLEGGLPVHADAYAAEADGIVLVNRIKPHTSFRGNIESGIVKMMTIGMGKNSRRHHAAQPGHGPLSRGCCLPPLVSSCARRPSDSASALWRTPTTTRCSSRPSPPKRLLEREATLQALAKQSMGRLAIDDIDVLVIEEMGKNVSGAGFDPNVTGRNNRGIEGFDTPRVKRIVVLDLTDASHGNAAGISLADVITMKLFRKIDFSAFYANIIASAYLDGGAIPLIMNTSQEAVALAIKSVPRVEPLDCRVVRVRNTLAVTHFEVSEPLADALRHDDRFDILGEPEPWPFDEQGETGRFASDGAARGRRRLVTRFLGRVSLPDCPLTPTLSGQGRGGSHFRFFFDGIRYADCTELQILSRPKRSGARRQGLCAGLRRR